MTERQPSPGRTPNLVLRQALRQAHLYVGALIAPSVLFFSLTGAVQLFSLHEAHGAYRPSPLIEKLGMVHKDQVFAPKPRRVPPKPAPSLGAPAPAEKGGPSPATMALKAFFLVVAAGLAASTGLGVWIGLSQARRRRAFVLVLVLGTVTPLILIAA